MRHIRSLEQASLSQPSVVTIGVFDGVHRGHQYLIRHLTDHARATGHVPVVLTFFPHPALVLRGFEPGYYLTLPDERARLLGELGVELVITHPFDDVVRHMRAADFVDSLLRHLNMRALWVGEDFALGYKREGDVHFLRAQGEQKGFSLRAIDLMDAGDERVSSSRVRAAVREGAVAEAARLLGRPYFLVGEIVEGVKRGRTIGIPTANFDVPPELAVPARGVYAGWVDLADGPAQAVINIGLRPTFDGSGALTIEAHLLDFSSDLYGQHLRLHFVERLRDEQQFQGVEALLAQIGQDIGRARDLLREQMPGRQTGL